MEDEEDWCLGGIGREEEELILEAGGELGREVVEGRAEVLLLTLECREKGFMDEGRWSGIEITSKNQRSAFQRKVGKGRKKRRKCGEDAEKCLLVEVKGRESSRGANSRAQRSGNCEM